MIGLFLCSTHAFYQHNAAPCKSCQCCCKQSLIITLAEGVRFKLVSLQAARLVEQAKSPSQKFLISNAYEKVAAKGVGPKVRSHEFPGAISST